MSGVCGDNRFEIIAKVKEHLIKATNIEMYPEELAQVDNILFRLWQLNYFNQCNKDSFIGDKNRQLCEQQLKIEVLEKENAILKKSIKSLCKLGR